MNNSDETRFRLRFRDRGFLLPPSFTRIPQEETADRLADSSCVLTEALGLLFVSQQVDRRILSVVFMYSPVELCFHGFCLWDAINSVLKIRRKERNADFDVKTTFLFLGLLF